MTGLVEAARQLMEVIGRIQDAINARYMRMILPHKLTVTQFKLLQHLYWHPEGLSVGELSGHLGLTNSAVSGIADRLEKEGWVERSRDPNDRRRVRIKLSQKGRELFTQRPRSVEEFWRCTLARLSEEERRRVLEGLLTLKEVVEKPEWPSFEQMHPSPQEMLTELLRDMMNMETSRVGMLLLIARLAEEEGESEIAAYLRQMSHEELNHAIKILGLLREMRTLKESLRRLLEEEERSLMAKMDAAGIAEEAGMSETADLLRRIGEDEKRHRKWIYKLLSSLNRS
ncbi:hypothetical protein DRP77_02870 [Candidatus Poribacteria bacterium]|nr:MAG: hypothetical protein DRP77_02870 [Candidatus Poribacteria bacterium]